MSGIFSLVSRHCIGDAVFLKCRIGGGCQFSVKMPGDVSVLTNSKVGGKYVIV